MTNQAAQTMPELPKPFQKAVIANRINTMAVRQGYEAGGYEKSPDLYTADQMHQYARDYAAALAQTAGVPDVLFDGYAVYQGMTDEARARINAGGVSDVLDSVVRLIRAQAAPAASGGKDVLSFGDVTTRFIDGMGWVVPCSDAMKYVDAMRAGAAVMDSMRAGNPPSAASVSERARALPESLRTEIFNAFDDITGLCRHLREGGPVDDDLNGLNEGLQEAIHIAGGMMARMSEPACEDSSADVKQRARELLAEAERGPQNDYGTVHRQIAHRALEQALTQQRGAPFAWAMTDHQADGPMTILTTNREDAKFWGEQGIDVEPLYKSPQPSADAVRELVQRWRSAASENDKLYQRTKGYEHKDRSDTLDACADELEYLLSGGSHA